VRKKERSGSEDLGEVVVLLAGLSTDDRAKKEGVRTPLGE